MLRDEIKLPLDFEFIDMDRATEKCFTLGEIWHFVLSTKKLASNKNKYLNKME